MLFQWIGEQEQRTKNIYTTANQTILYDVQDFRTTQFETKKKRTQPKLAGNTSSTRKTVISSCETTVTHPADSVKIENSGNMDASATSLCGIIKTQGRYLLSWRSARVVKTTYVFYKSSSVTVPGGGSAFLRNSQTNHFKFKSFLSLVLRLIYSLIGNARLPFLWQVL